MSINPVQGIGPADAELLVEKNPKAAPRPSTPDCAAAVRSDLGTRPKQETPDSPKSPAPAELPQDEVRVQHDSETNGTIVIEYMDHAGHVILQVPSSQVLGVARAIEEDFRQAAKDRANLGAERVKDEGGKP